MLALHAFCRPLQARACAAADVPMCLSLTQCFCAESHARQLVALNLSSTGLTREGVPDLSRQLQRFASVQDLELRNAFVDETEFAFICDNFRCLTSLNVCNNPLVNVPPVVSLLTKLKSLDVSACRSLTSFPDEIYDLKKLSSASAPKIAQT